MSDSERLASVEAELANIRARDEAKQALPRPPGHNFSVPKSRSEQLEAADERRRAERERAAEQAAEAYERARMADTPERERLEARLAELDGAMTAIYDEQAQLEHKLEAVARRRAEVNAELGARERRYREAPASQTLGQRLAAKVGRR